MCSLAEHSFRLTKNIQEHAKIEKNSSRMKGGSMLFVADMLKRNPKFQFA